jgi:hypothetical protein
METTNRRGMAAWIYCCPAVASIRDSTCSNGAGETRKSPRNGLLRAIIRISTRTPEAASTADIASCIRRLGAPRNEPKATVRAPPAITTNQTISGMVVCAASSLSCLASPNRAKVASYAEAALIGDVYNLSAGFADPEKSSIRN